MPLADLISPQAVIPVLRSGNKKQALHDIAVRAASLGGLDEREVLDVLLQRERLGSTGVGDGIALPHGKLASIDHLFGVFARLERPIEFDSMDGQPVDLIFALFAPESAGADHLKGLARVARILRSPQLVRQLRGTSDASALHAMLTETIPSSNAA